METAGVPWNVETVRGVKKREGIPDVLFTVASSYRTAWIAHLWCATAQDNALLSGRHWTVFDQRSPRN